MTVEQMTDDDYFAFDAVDQTALKKYLVSPLAYSQYLTGEHSSSPQFEFGKAAHSLILGSGPEVLVKPNLRTKEGKARYAETLKLHDAWLRRPGACVLRRALRRVSLSLLYPVRGGFSHRRHGIPRHGDDRRRP